MNYENIFAIHFGPFSLSFVCPSKTITDNLKHFFSGYECDRVPDFSIKIFTSDEFPPPLLQLQKQWVPILAEARSFEIGPCLIRGTLNLKKKECTISVHKDFFSLPLFNVFQGFLYRLYYTLCFSGSLKSGFIHGCGVVKDNKGYLFIGHHQSGKTTAGRLSDGLIIHDDQIIITLDKEKLFMDSPPLFGRFRNHQDKPCQIGNIFYLVQDTRVSIRRLNSAIALKCLYDEIISPLTLFPSDGKEERAKKGKLCFEILKLVPVLELHFDKEGEFWKVLADMQRGRG